ncbi:MAG: hypothetical protein OEY49_00655 [Candidatus Heimdallarchaeota archaeon]|nr:hypothetical protein [Candidatus Heimdallarchaeota archaeon]
MARIQDLLVYILIQFPLMIVNAVRIKFSNVLKLSKKEWKDIIIYRISSPSAIWFISIYVNTLFAIIGFNIVRDKDGTFFDKIFGGPSYYSRLFLTYGLNSKSNPGPWAEGMLAWIFAPFAVFFMGLGLFYLKEGGWARNSAIFSDPEGVKSYAFFSDLVFGYETNIFGKFAGEGSKWNLFYIGLIWVPMFATITITILYEKKLDRKTSIVTRTIINFLIAIWIGTIIARVGDPSLNYDWSNLWNNVMNERERNKFVIINKEYNYHPTFIAMYFVFIQFIPSILLGLANGIIAIRKQIRFEWDAYKERQNLELEREAHGVKKLPWVPDLESEINNNGEDE